jgi:transposase
LIISLDAHKQKSYHPGFGKSVKRSNLAKANESREYRIFEELAYYLIDIARKKLSNDDFAVKGKVYAFDSTTIDLCLSVFWWAKFRKAKGGIKVHTLYDITTQIPAFVHITEATVHDVKAMSLIPYEIGAYYIFDRGYVDYKRLYKITQLNSYFVIRSKKNMKFQCSHYKTVDASAGVMSDQEGVLVGFYNSKKYPKKLRKVVYYDAEKDRAFVYLSNNFELPPEQIALLYKNRWQIELFFKWIKQHLKIKSFWGTSENAVRIQIYTAIITYCLVSIVGHDLKLGRSTYEILTILGISLLDKTPVKELLSKMDINDVKDHYYKQLSISFF